jgi:bifunctional enzyme CysN/CysC
MDTISENDFSDKSLLRFVTTGSVDDGKSTLIGRLLCETNSIFEDQYEAIAQYSKRKGGEKSDLSLLLDGLAAEREQGITIDVAYRFFSTAKRKFIIADTPGHEQYTRNMVTGASTADLAIILIDASKGVLTQSKRHGFILSLFQIPHFVIAINKMDLVNYDQKIFNSIVNEFSAFSKKLAIHDLTYIPVSALKGDNIVHRSNTMPWYDGNTLLHALENVHNTGMKNLVDFRFPVQYVIRPDPTFRGYAGKISSGSIRPGEEVLILPSGTVTHIKSIIADNTEKPEAVAGQSVIITVTNEVDISRGSMIVRTHNLPQVTSSFEAVLCWLDEKPCVIEDLFILKHTTHRTKAFVSGIRYSIDVNTLHRQPSDTLHLNEIGMVDVKSMEPIMLDAYRVNRSTGSFILIDPRSNRTVAAGIIRGVKQNINSISPMKPKQNRATPLNIFWRQGAIDRFQWEKRHGHRAVVLWFTGLSGAGKTTLAQLLEKRLFERGCHVVLLDGDKLRQGLCKNLAFSREDRIENIRRAGETARLFFDQGNIVLCTFISPFLQNRQFARSLFPEKFFIEIYLKCDLANCISRDTKGLYKKAKRGALPDFTGISSPYEEPSDAEIVIETDKMSIEQSLQIIEKYLSDFNLFL